MSLIIAVIVVLVLVSTLLVMRASKGDENIKEENEDITDDLFHGVDKELLN